MDDPAGKVKEYLAFVSEYADYYLQSPMMTFILDERSLLDFMERDGRSIGIMSRSPYVIFVSDLVVDGNGKMMVYQRVIPTNKGGVVIVPIFKGRYLLLEQYRHIIGSNQLCFPRGFGERDLDAEDNARAEMLQETGCRECDMEYIGRIHPDSGMMASVVDVYRCVMHDMDVQIGHEGIIGYTLVEGSELERMISDGEITDGFTLSAYALCKVRS